MKDTEKPELREKITQDTALFLKQGGTITQVPVGQSAHDYKFEKTKSGYIRNALWLKKEK